MPPEAQTRLLRVLQEGEFTSVGGRQPIKANVRIIAATHRDLRNAIRQGQFREDLFYRLNVVPIRLPPLRERVEDIPLLARHFLERAQDDGLPAKTLDQGAVEQLKRYSWPGNVREVENVMRRLAALCPHETIGAEQIAAELVEIAPAPSEVPAASGPEPLVRAVERHIRDFLAAQHDGGVAPSDIYDRVIAEVERPLIRLTSGGDPGEPDQGRRHAGAQSQHAAQEDPRPRHPRGARTDVNVAPPPGSLRPEPPAEPSPATEVSRARSVLARIADILLGKAVTLVLAALAFAVGLATFVFLARGAPFVLRPGVSVGLVLANLSAVLLLVAVLAGRLTRVWVERRRGSAGARLHVRLVLLFGGVAVAPAILVACFAVAFFHFGIQAWFNDPIRQAVTESLQVSHGYLDEHRDNIRAVALEMANDLTRAGQYPDRRSVGVRRGAGDADHAARPDRGGDLRSADAAGACRGRAVRRHGYRAAVAERHHRRRRAATSWCWPAATARACRRWHGSIRRRR